MACEDSSKEAQRLFKEGLLLFRGGRSVDIDGEHVDEVAAAEKFQRAADLGNTHAMYTLGVCFERGRGVEQDLSRAAALYRDAAHAGGHARALHNLGVCYERGWGVPRDSATAAMLYFHACGKGYPPAIYNLGLCFERGLGVRLHMETAVKLYSWASEKGDANAMYRLGLHKQSQVMKDDGGVGEDEGKRVGNAEDPSAAQLFEAAASLGHIPATYNLAVCLEHGGLGVSRNVPLALQLYARANHHGHAAARFALARIATLSPKSQEMGLQMLLEDLVIRAEQDMAANFGLFSQAICTMWHAFPQYARLMGHALPTAAPLLASVLASGAASMYIPSHTQVDPTELVCKVAQPSSLLGKGHFGYVVSGTFQGRPCAVKLWGVPAHLLDEEGVAHRATEDAASARLEKVDSSRCERTGTLGIVDEHGDDGLHAADHRRLAYCTHHVGLGPQDTAPYDHHSVGLSYGDGVAQSGYVLGGPPKAPQSAHHVCDGRSPPSERRCERPDASSPHGGAERMEKGTAQHPDAHSMERSIRQALEIGAALFTQMSLTKQAKRHTVHVYGVVHTSAGLGIVMERAVHGTLRSCIRKGLLPTRSQRLDVLHQLAKGLVALHDGRATTHGNLRGAEWGGGVIHGDLHWGNVLVTSLCPVRVKIADFGLAKQILHHEESIERVDAFTGYLRAMPPETTLGRASRTTDVYSLGVLVEQLLSPQDASQDARIRMLLRRCLAPQDERANALDVVEMLAELV